MSERRLARTDSTAVDVRQRILDTACTLFYQQGVRAVGVDLVVEKAGVAKTSLYRYFNTKDELVAAFLQQEDQTFWATWDAVAQEHVGDVRAELEAHLTWLGERAGQPEYRGCPQLNIAAEFPEATHPARKVATVHKQELRRRLRNIAVGLGATDPDALAGKLAMLINGALVSSSILNSGEATLLLRQVAQALIAESHAKKAVRKK